MSESQKETDTNSGASDLERGIVLCVLHYPFVYQIFSSLFAVTFSLSFYACNLTLVANTCTYVDAGILYSIPSFCFYHFLRNISMIINTYASKLHLFNRMKKVQITCFEPLLLTHHYFFYTQPKIEILRGFCIAKDMNVPRMITLTQLLPNGEKM